ncbi:MAG: ubiquinone/menaquinone biosynthesis methyltransferase [Candidatus Marinimicrobia bacterium]|nr:ubiquinone/menaquinone biosynthesis methyltransferase [Candidatus Neomarinimicrobiota bacterium]
MFDDIASRYDLLNRFLSLGMDILWRRAMVQSLQLSAGDTLLDLACGTGDVAKAVARRHPDVKIFGGDPAPAMLERAVRKLPQLRPVVCVAEQLPFGDDAFEAVTVAFGVRNFADLEVGLAEIARVLKPGGQLAVLEFAQADRGPLQRFYRWYVGTALPLIGGMLSRSDAYRYLPDSIERFPSPPEFIALLESAGISNIQTRYWLGGSVWLYSGRLADA